MSKVSVSIPKGTRDFGPEEVEQRQYIMGLLRQVFECFGYRPLETPAMEQLTTLTGKYGDEGDKLLFRVLNSGDFLSKASPDVLQHPEAGSLMPYITEKGLRYDLTIPFARYVVMNQHAITLPFRRYQMQPVWRADRPQKGRYREFMQCDVDVVGSDSLLLEAELIQIYAMAFEQLQLPVTILVNHRQLLEGLAEVVGAADRFTSLVMAIDKLDKIGWDAVKLEMTANGISREAADKVQAILTGQATDLQALKSVMSASEKGRKGIAELEKVFSYLDASFLSKVSFTLTLARGLDYYTGTIFEVKANDADMGSIGGGGRYDNLTGVFGLPGISGVGVSFGLDRIQDVMNAKGLFPAQSANGTQVLFVNFDEAGEAAAFRYVTKLRSQGIRAEVYPEAAKLKKQFKYADANRIPYVVIIGEEELANGTVALKDMVTGQQEILAADALPGRLGL